ncbi:ArsC/Spx/MgsR family protein [Caldimonas tepidiphila]|uniref:ArsC/Spx/MgsR family protein n=1 Tax=Caldimonas tepidiphila TaxID=2315841 RepID=UPI000E5A7E04|nr:ArsC/Spx/MgsR family protein [Caldimonas tepidiphila]
MSDIVFYGKPGCGGNARQKALLQAAGHAVEPRDLLAWPWTAAALLEFLAPLPVPQWFNRAAPRVKSGEVVPEALDAAQALALLLAEPLLVRRPLMQCGAQRLVGFDPAEVDALWGLQPRHAAWPRERAEGCAAAAADVQAARCRSARE